MYIIICFVDLLAECPQFELFYLKGRMGTCGMIEYHEGGLKLDYCVEKCIDLPGCLGTTFDKDLERCTYHNCTDSVYATTDHYFVKKVCLDESKKLSIMLMKC